MYRNLNDKRVKRSAEMFKNGLISCLKEKKLQEISISDIAQASGVSRTTFYRLFDTPIDILAYACDSMAKESMEILNKKDSMSRHGLITQFFELLMDNCDLVEAIVKSGRLEIIQNSFNMFYGTKILKDIEGFSESEKEYARVISGGIITSLLFVWQQRGRKESAEQLYDIYYRYIKSELKLL